ncbi:hypothetical protein ABIB73_000023 [Bradyrhizobium sp. F1.4.3]|uniref:hypothetical protein n=1 Tax=Bradyrhizobium sp. F1.4.3 TaxID=3156356 RepID=UPI00339756EA
MALTIICVTGPGRTGKSSIIKEFTERHLKYKRDGGDVLGIFPMPRRKYAIGVSGSGDALKFILRGEEFVTRYDGLRAMIVASRSEGETIQEVRRFAKAKKASLYEIETTKLAESRQHAAILKNVARIKRLLPR